ncbi:MAG: hypothetical protein LBC53_06115 [Spirochaetaceae bacterium]|jgi:hypothetical protein|nr:hypothetical protein [Spirochaetaceae bacterium]
MAVDYAHHICQNHQCIIDWNSGASHKLFEDIIKSVYKNLEKVNINGVVRKSKYPEPK